MYVKMCYVPYVAIFYSISKTRKISMVPLCYVMLRASFIQLQWLLFHSISAKPPICSVFAGFSCVALWCWLDVWFARLAAVPLFASSSTQPVLSWNGTSVPILFYFVWSLCFPNMNEFSLLCQPKVCFTGLWDNSRPNSMLLLHIAGNCIK